MSSSQLTHIFQRGRLNHQPENMNHVDWFRHWRFFEKVPPTAKEHTCASLNGNCFLYPLFVPYHVNQLNYIYIREYKYTYIYRLKAGGSLELRGTLSLDAIPERSFLYTDGGGGGVGGV